MLHRKRLQFALERIEPSQWERFEQFASAFLSSEFPTIRTVASASGDKGRDAELFQPEGNPTTVLQYSVTESWAAKIRDTVKKIKKNHPDAKEIIYVTNQAIGAKCDDLRSEVRKGGLILDVRDRSFFLDRFEGNSRLEKLAEALANEIVNPLLQDNEIIERRALALTAGESRAALVFLEMQWEDDTRDKGLTKTAFDALVRTALRGTAYPESVLPRAAIHEAVLDLLPARDQAFVLRETDKALSRLTKHFIRHMAKDDTFCLTFEERERLKERLTEVEIDDQSLRQELIDIVSAVAPDRISGNSEIVKELAANSRVALEKFLLQRGEMFAHALHTGQLSKLGLDLVQEVVENHLRSTNSELRNDEQNTQVICATVEHSLRVSSPTISKHLRSLADSYTLFAFLRETPDIQSAVQKMFSSGEIWLDTSILLPLFAEDLLEDDDSSQFRRLIRTAIDVGLKLRVTPGVIEEVERHVNRSLACSSADRAAWKGAIPYLFAYYITSGAPQASFSAWTKKFIGKARPEDDIIDFLRDEFKIEVTDISNDAEKAPSSIKGAIKEHWLRIHAQRRKGAEFDPMLSHRLADHDSQNFLGVLVRRSTSSENALGYSSWWLTLDNQAFGVAQAVSKETGERLSSPVMSADFLANYLAFGPLREHVARKHPEGLPVALDPNLVEYLTPDLIALASAVREQHAGESERIIRREVRDALDNARRRQGLITKRGLKTDTDF